MPNARAAAALPVTATKCDVRSAPGSACVSHAFALAALASVSCVVNVFDVTTNSVVAGSSCASARDRCSGSTFDTNATGRPESARTRASGACVLVDQPERGDIETLLRAIDAPTVPDDCQTLGARGVGREKLCQRCRGERALALGERLQRNGIGELGHGEKSRVRLDF